MQIEEALREIRYRAGLLRFLASTAITSDVIPDANTFGGISAVCREIEDLADAVKNAAGARVLAIEVDRRAAG